MTRFSVIALALFLTGCASTGLESIDVPELPDLPLVSEKEPEVPTRVIPVWTDTVLHRGGKTVRGFGGRVIFYGESRDKPINVDGAVVVYAWDDTAGRGQEVPDRKYKFKADDLEKHFGMSKIGPSYNFWLPWDAVGGGTKHITLVTRFVSTAGGEVTSNAAHVVLPGPMPSDQKRADTERPMLSARSDSESPALVPTPRQPTIQQLGFEEITPARTERTSNATTIDLPLHLARGSQPELPVVDAATSPRARIQRSGLVASSTTRRSHNSLNVVDFESEGSSVREKSQQLGLPKDSAQPSSRFGPRQLPVRSSRSDRRSFSRDQTQPDRLASRFGSSRKQRPPHVSVQQKIAKDAAEAKARRAEAWGQYQSSNRHQD